DCYKTMGDAFAKSGQREQAAAAFRDAAGAYEKLTADTPSTQGSSTSGADKARWRQELGYTCVRQGEIMRQLGRLPEAEAVLSRALEVHEKLVADSPADRLYNMRLAWNQLRLGDVRRARSQRPEAERAYRETVVLVEKLTTKDW